MIQLRSARVGVPPPVTNLAELGDWFRTKPGGTNALDGFVQTLAENEGVLFADVDLEAARRFPGYFYRAEPARLPAKERVESPRLDEP